MITATNHRTALTMLNASTITPLMPSGVEHNPYTKAAAKRILSFATRIEAVRELRNCVQVTYRSNGGRCSTFLSKKAFVVDFSRIREEKSQLVSVVESSLYSYTVKSANNYYVVRPDTPDVQQRCECADCNFRGAFCKHQIAVADYCKESLGVA